MLPPARHCKHLVRALRPLRRVVHPPAVRGPEPANGDGGGDSVRANSRQGCLRAAGAPIGRTPLFSHRVEDDRPQAGLAGVMPAADWCVTRAAEVGSIVLIVHCRFAADECLRYRREVAAS